MQPRPGPNGSMPGSGRCPAPSWTADLWPPAGPLSVVLAVPEQLDAAGVVRLQRAVRRLLRSGTVSLVTCDVRRLAAADLAAVGALARLQLTARRAGGSMRVRAASDGLRAVLALAGLADTVPAAAPAAGCRPVPGWTELSVQLQRQAELLEEPGVEEDVEMHDPPV